MYERITDEDPYKVPMRIYPAIHYTMGGLWVDYNLMSTIPGLFVCGEANFSDHGANRLGASALMQGLADGYFVLPYTLGNYLASAKPAKVSTDHPAFREAEADVDATAQAAPRHQRQADGRHVPPRARQDHLGQLRHGPQRGRASNDALEKIPALRAGVLGGRLRPRRRTARSTSRSRRPAAWPTSWSSASCSASTPSSAASRAAATSARSSRPRTARPSATTSTSATSPPGNTPATGNRPIRNVEPLAFENVDAPDPELQIR